MDYLMPSGIPVGSSPTVGLVKELTLRKAVPPVYFPVIEDGSYEDFEACVFRVCASMIFEVMLEDMQAECASHGIGLEFRARHWSYRQPIECVTSAQFCLRMPRGMHVEDFCHFLARKYGFVYTRLSVNYRRERELAQRFEYLTYADIEVEAEITWSTWM